jgi:5-methylthioadenosine/S-adenosylhomocysteine deaminase
VTQIRGFVHAAREHASCDMMISRRRVVAACAAIGAVPSLSSLAVAQAADDAMTLDRLERTGADPRRRILIKGGTVISMEPAVGDFPQADLLIEGKKISAVAPNLRDVGDAIVVDAHDMIVIPGFVDPHRHAWEGQLRGLIPNAGISEYMAATHRGFAPFYRPQDMYAGNLITALGCIDAGITCIIDNSHNSRSQEHSNEAIRALFDSGIRAVHASGAPTFGDWQKQWPQDLERLQKQFFASDDQLVTLRIYQIGLVRENLNTARRLGLWISSEGIQPPAWMNLDAWHKDGALDSRHTFNHMYGDIPERAWELIREIGATVNVCPRSDSQYMLGAGIGGLQAVLDHGLRPGISIDNETSYGTDMFTEMRVGYHGQRAMAQYRKSKGEADPPTPVSVRDMLEFATVRGAWCAGLMSKVGSLSPGKEADILLIRANDVNTLPLTNAVATVVQFANVNNVDTVFIAGDVRKWRGTLRSKPPGYDLASIRKLVTDSRDYLLAQRGFKLNILE